MEENMDRISELIEEHKICEAEAAIDYIAELNKEIKDLEIKLGILKNERMAFTAASSSQLTKFEYAQFKKYVRDSDDFHRFVWKKYHRPKNLSIFDGWDPSQKCFQDIVAQSIMEVTDNRTSEFNQMSYEEKTRLRNTVKRQAMDFYKDFIEKKP